MAERPDRVCVPIEVEPIPLYREPAWAARLRRAQRRERRRQRSSQRRWRMLTWLRPTASSSRARR